MLNAMKNAARWVVNKVQGAAMAVVGALGLGAAALSASQPANAATDFSSILTGLDASTAETAIIAAAVILAAVGFAKWGAKKVGKFFG